MELTDDKQIIGFNELIYLRKLVKVLGSKTRQKLFSVFFPQILVIDWTTLNFMGTNKLQSVSVQYEICEFQDAHIDDGFVSRRF